MNAFFLNSEFWNDNILILGKQTSSLQEFNHFTKVLRIKLADKVIVFNGQGKKAICKAIEITKQDVKLEIIETKEFEKPSSQITLALGYGKAARRGFILEKCVELEADALWFWQAERSQFPLPKDIKTGWQEQLIAGVKQCHNPFLPKLEIMTKGASEIIEATKDFEHKQLLVEKDYEHEEFLSAKHLGNEGKTICVIGPEGGFSLKEINLFLANGFKTYSMGDRVLRWETAALMALGLHWWKKQE